jgi:SAM-dependent methyltransferase
VSSDDRRLAPIGTPAPGRTAEVSERPGGASIRGIALVCPRDRTPLVDGDTWLACPHCGTRFPRVRGVPVLINDANSVFAVCDYLGNDSYEGAAYGRADDQASGWRRMAHRVVYRLRNTGTSLRSPPMSDIIAYVRHSRAKPRVLVVGAGGTQVGDGDACVVHTDVAFARHVELIADAHDLPFAERSFDLVVAVAVLEHVADPQRCVAEFVRVLDRGGFVYAATPFLQPVHMGAYDFTRFTPIGHRRLFRQFDEVAAGVALGVGSAAASAFQAFLLGFSSRRFWRRLAGGAALLATPPLRLMDRLLRHNLDAVSGCWFFGRLREGPPVSDRELVQTYRQGFGIGPERLSPPNEETRIT